MWKCMLLSPQFMHCEYANSFMKAFLNAPYNYYLFIHSTQCYLVKSLFWNTGTKAQEDATEWEVKIHTYFYTHIFFILIYKWQAGRMMERNISGTNNSPGESRNLKKKKGEKKGQPVVFSQTPANLLLVLLIFLFLFTFLSSSRSLIFFS